MLTGRDDVVKKFHVGAINLAPTFIDKEGYTVLRS